MGKSKHKHRWNKRKETPLYTGKVYKDTLARCQGCPYPRHGLSCLGKDGTCTRTDMNAVYRNLKGDNE